MAEVRESGTGFVWCGLFEPDDEHLHEAVEAGVFETRSRLGAEQMYLLKREIV